MKLLHLPLSTALFALGLTALAPNVRAQAQSLLSSNQVVVTRVEPVGADALLISGINFGKFGNTPVVSVALPGAKAATALSSRYTAGSGEIIATLPTGTSATAPGSYRLMVSFGNGTAATDVFEFTIGAVGLKGDKGEKGNTGAKGDKGDQGVQGIQGIQGDKGEQGVQGIQGVQGAKGDQGTQGMKGDKGDQGLQGFQGAQGLKGDKGDTGAKGDKGDTGAQGVQGVTGVTGLQSLPIFQSKPFAIAGGVAVGQYWVHAGSGQVRRMMDQNNDE